MPKGLCTFQEIAPLWFYSSGVPPSESVFKLGELEIYLLDISSEFVPYFVNF